MQAISIGSLSEKLGMDEEATEKWIVNLIRCLLGLHRDRPAAAPALCPGRQHLPRASPGSDNLLCNLRHVAVPLAIRATFACTPSLPDLPCRNARLNAKIDSKAGTVVMQAASLSAYEQLLERARGLGLRTLDLSNAVFGALRA